MRSTSLRTFAFYSVIFLCTINVVISEDDTDMSSNEKPAGRDLQTERTNDSLESTVKNSPTAPQLAIPHTNISKGDNDDRKPHKKRDKGDAVTITASARLKEPIYKTTGFVVFAGIVVVYWLFAVIAITLLVYFCFIREASNDESSDDEEDDEDSQLKKYGKSNKGNKSNKGKDMKGDSESDEDEEDDKEKPVVKKKK